MTPVDRPVRPEGNDTPPGTYRPTLVELLTEGIRHWTEDPDRCDMEGREAEVAAYLAEIVPPRPTFGDKLIEFLGEPTLPFLVRVRIGEDAKETVARWRDAGAPVDVPAIKKMFAASAAPETSPDPTDLSGYEHLIFLHDRFTDVIGEQHGATPGDVAWALLPAVHAEIVRLLADEEAREAIAARPATPPETTEH